MGMPGLMETLILLAIGVVLLIVIAVVLTGKK